MWALAPAGAAPSAPAASAPADTIAAMDTPRHVVREGFKRNCVIGFILAPRFLGSRCLEPRAHDAERAQTGSRNGSVDGSHCCKEIAKRLSCTSCLAARTSSFRREARLRRQFVGAGAYPGAVTEDGAASAGSQERFE